MVDKMIKIMKSLYVEDVIIFRGKKHYYLGINLDLSVEGQVAVTTMDCLKGVISDFKEAEIITGTAVFPAAEHLYTIREGCKQKKLDKKRRTDFYHVVAQLLFTCPRAKKDIQKATFFLTKRVRDPDEDYWGKLKHPL